MCVHPQGSGFGGPTSQLKPYGATIELAQLHPEDLATIQAITEKGIPVVTVLVSGRPLVVNHELAASTAFVVIGLGRWKPASAYPLPKCRDLPTSC